MRLTNSTSNWRVGSFRLNAIAGAKDNDLTATTY